MVDGHVLGIFVIQISSHREPLWHDAVPLALPVISLATLGFLGLGICIRSICRLHPFISNYKGTNQRRRRVQGIYSGLLLTSKTNIPFADGARTHSFARIFFANSGLL